MIGYDLGVISAVFGVLVAFGLLYDRIVGWLERNGYDEGYTAMLVVGGVLVTLAGVAFVDWRAALLALGAFVCSGLPMVIGSWWRHVQRRKQGLEAQRQGVLDDQGSGLAQ